jgi:predicted dinucleotide-binding enzyme
MTAADHITTVSIIGAGSWGTAIAVVLAETHPTLAIRFWAYEESVVSSINELHENREFLPNVPLPFSISATNSLKEAVLDADMIIIAVPSKVIPDTAQKLRRYISDRACMWAFLPRVSASAERGSSPYRRPLRDDIPQLKGKTVAISPRSQPRGGSLKILITPA